MVVSLPIFVWRQTLSELTLGPGVPKGGCFCVLNPLTMIVEAIGQIVDAYLRAFRCSGICVRITLGRLFLNFA